MVRPSWSQDVYQVLFLYICNEAQPQALEKDGGQREDPPNCDAARLPTFSIRTDLGDHGWHL